MKRFETVSLSRRHVLRAAIVSACSALLAACTRQARRVTAPPTSTAGTSPPTPASTGTALPSCVVRPAATEGPYFVDERLNRSDIRVDPSDGSTREGIPVRLVMNVSRVDGSACVPLAGAQVDVWHCDALGVYSDVSAQNTVGKKFLRGYQLTDAGGRAEFITVYPGWYRGRTIHVHFKIRTGAPRATEFTSQFYFDDALSDQVMARAPYSGRGTRDTRNADDMVYRGGGNSGPRLLLPLTAEGSGYTGRFDIGLQL